MFVDNTQIHLSVPLSCIKEALAQPDINIETKSSISFRYLKYFNPEIFVILVFGYKPP